MRRWMLVLAVLSLSACKEKPAPESSASPPPQAVAAKAWPLPDPKGLERHPQAELIRYGEQLLRNTPQLVGPDQPPDKRFAGNRLACASCHLDAGKKVDALGFVGIAHDFPQYRARENRKITLEERIDGCFERSLNGRSPAADSREMRALVAYMQWLSSEVPSGQKVAGRGTPKLDTLDRAADPVRGKAVYTAKCAQCHQANGAGIPKVPGKPSEGYVFPPLWGQDAYNNGAGMHRLLTAASFIKANMPLGNPNLTLEEAYDVAAYVHSQPHPVKAGLENDFPDRTKKPVDAPFPPYLDTFPQQQHEYGPYAPIQAAYAR
jgi:thiosulfate dehydrogenase